MMQAIRGRTTKWVIRLFLLIIAVSFALWGVPEAFQGAKDPTVIKVGDIDIPLSKLRSEFDQMLSNAQRQFGRNLTEAEGKQLGLLDVTTNQLIAQNLMDNQVKALKLASSDDAVREVVFSQQQFKDQTGKFNRIQFEQLLRQNRYTEASYIAAIRQEITRRQLVETIALAGTLPALSAELLYKNRHESRLVEIASLSLENVVVPEPTEAQLEEYLKANQDKFTASEYRKITYLALSPEVLQGSMSVSEEEIAQEYELTRNSLGTAERRVIEQIILSDEAKAQEASTKLKAGGDFVKVAQEIAGLAANDLVLGTMTKAELPPEFGDPVFTLAEGVASEPVKSGFGWHLFRVTKIEPESVPTLEEARDQLRNNIALNKAIDESTNKIKELEDALAGGAPLEEISTQMGLPLVVIENADANGLDAQGAKAANVPAEPGELLTRAFLLASGEISELIPGVGDTTYVARVDNIVEKRSYTLAEKRLALHEGWTAKQQSEQAAKLAEELKKKAESGNLKDLAEAGGWQYRLSEPVTRLDRGDNPELGREAMLALFDQKLNGVTMAPSADGKKTLLIKIKEIKGAEGAAEGDLAELKTNVERLVQNDSQSQLQNALKEAFPAEIYQNLIDARFQSASGS